MPIGQENMALGYDDEYLIQDVIRRWVENYISAEQYDTARFLMSCITGKWSKRKNIYLDPGIKEFLAQYPADTTLFLSDFYTSADDLKKLLNSRYACFDHCGRSFIN
jgi:hypothetical protein